jgi:hypothetical protein
MKKIGILVFIVTAVVGIVIASFFSFGRATGNLFNISINSKVTGSGNLASEIRQVDEFTGVQAGSAFRVEITAQKDFEVEVEADDNILPLIKTYVEGGTLKIESEKRIDSRTPIRVRIYAPVIESIDASGASKVSLADAAGSELSVSASGASKVNLAGNVDKLSLDVSGASSIDGEGLNVTDADIEASGASTVGVHVTGTIRAEASGASRITYTGNPTNAEKKSSGASSVTQK